MPAKRLRAAAPALALALLSGCGLFAPAETLPSIAPEAPVVQEMALAQQPTPTPTPTPEPVEHVLTFVGDCTLASSQYAQGTASSFSAVMGGDYGYPFRNVLDYFTGDDLTVANLECVLCSDSVPSSGKTFTFRAQPDYVNILTQGSVECVTLANNHSADYGEAGLQETRQTLEAAGIHYVNQNATALVTTDSGLTVGFYGGNFVTADQVRAGVSALREAGAQFVVAALHFGTEGSYRPNADQVAQAHAAIDAGADLVYGSHPHVVQTVEEYNGKYIYYSLSNFCFGGNTAPRDMDSFLLRVTVTEYGDGTVAVTDREHIPCSISSVEGWNNYQPTPYGADSEAWNRVMSKLDGSFTGPDLNVDYSFLSPTPETSDGGAVGEGGGTAEAPPPAGAVEAPPPAAA